MNFMYDLVNLLVVLSILFAVLIYLKLDTTKSAILVLHLIAIFILNDVLFPASYMSDQFRYVTGTQAIREGNRFNLTFGADFANFIFSLTPIPFITSVRSIGMANFLLFLWIFVFLKRKHLSNNSIDYFILLYPSFLLYSSLALRDNLIFIFMFITLYLLLIKRKFIGFIFILVPLYILKFQNMLIICLTVFVYHLIKGGFKINKIIFLLFTAILMYYFRNIPIERFTLGRIFSIETLEGMRFALFSENYGYNYAFVSQLAYNPVNSFIEFIYVTIKGFVRFSLGPFIWSVNNPFQFIQSIENIVIILLIISIAKSKKYFKYTKDKLMYLNFMMLISFSLYGFVIYNLGSAARYKFTFISVYIIFSYYFLSIDKFYKRSLINE